MSEKKHSNDHLQSDEIDLLVLLRLVWSKKTFIIKTTILFICLGLIIALGSAKEYKAEAKILPELSGKESSISNLMKQVGGMGMLSGLNLGGMNSDDVIKPLIYPEIIGSTPFLIKLLDEPIFVPSSDSSVTLLYYLKNLQNKSFFEKVSKYTINLPDLLREKNGISESRTNVIINSSPLLISKELDYIIKNLKNRIHVYIDDNTKIITLSAEMRDPTVSAQVAAKALQFLTEYLKEYNIQKAENTLSFLTDQLDQARSEYTLIQKKRAEFIDENKSIISAKFEIEKNKIDSQYDLLYSIYSTLAQQREQAKILVQENTPVFKVVSPIQVPIQKSKPMRTTIIIVFTIMGGIIGSLIVVLRFFYKTFQMN